MDTAAKIELAAALLTIVGPVFVALLTLLYQYVLGKLDAAKRAKVEEIVNTTVYAVEQAHKDKPGPDKYEAAMYLINAALKARGIKAQPEWLYVLVHAALKAIKDNAPTSGEDTRASAGIGFRAGA